ncbi:MAG: (d)CMP kinase, partial [Gammaproteobacteria bacterium]
ALPAWACASGPVPARWRMVESLPPVIAIDGPGGVGKGTLALALAARLGYHLLDSGALYRLLALAAGRAGLSADDEPALIELARGLDIEFRPVAATGPVAEQCGVAGRSDADLTPEAPSGSPPHESQAHRVVPWLDGAPVGDAHRSEACGDRASRIAVLGGVREALLERQRRLRRPPGLVADGRDMGTVVFPDANLKLFLTASLEERARRRHKQLLEQGVAVSLAALFEDIAERDRRNRERTAAPLAPAADAVVLDSSTLSAEAVLEHVLGLVLAAGLDAGTG